MFPQFTNYSVPLLVFFIWGLIFGIIFLFRYIKKRNISDLFLAGVVLIYTYQRTTYTVGFMAWYDTYPNTKINYFLIPLMLAFGPLVYFYVKSVISPGFKLRKKDFWHFAPQVILIAIRVLIYLYDVMQPGFDDVQNGILFQSLIMKYLGFFLGLFIDISVGVYLVLSFILYWKYRAALQDIYSNHLKWELIWLRNFLGLFILVYVIMFVLQEIDGNLTDLHYTDYWWGHLVASLSLVYLGIYGYITDVNKLHTVNLEAGANQVVSVTAQNEPQDVSDSKEQIQAIDELMKTQKPYLNNTLTLAELAKLGGCSVGELSQIINSGSGKNFNDYVNAFRVQAVKDAIKEGKAEQYTLLSIAYECGFNSKATFNRTFKKLEGKSPSEYMNGV